MATTKQRILDVSLQLFMQVGFENTYMDDVARNSGVTKPTVYYYFKDKQALFEASAAQFLDQMAQMMRPEGVEDLSLEALLDAAFESLPEFIARYQEISGTKDRASLLRSQVFVYDAMTRIPGFRSAFVALYADAAQLVQRACEKAARRGEIRPGIDMSTIGILVNSTIEGLLLMAMVDPKLDLERLGRGGAKTLWHMLKM